MKFGFLSFEIKDEKIYLTGHGDYQTLPQGFVEVQIAGGNSPTHKNGKSVRTSESNELKYISHKVLDNKLIIVQRSNKVEVRTVFTSFSNGNTITIYNEITNIDTQDIILENAPTFVLKQLFDKYLEESNDVYFTKLLQGHHDECQPRKNSLYDLGLYDGSGEGQRKVFFASVGSQSTKEQLPIGFLEDTKNNKTLMFRIDSSSSWYYEMSDLSARYYLSLGSANLNYLGWAKKLNSGETYKTVKITLSYGESFNQVVCGMTDYLRSIKPHYIADEKLPTIFNEYMHLSWDSPNEERVAMLAPIIAKTGVEYYVIDCGWHNEEPGDKIYPYVGQWKESKARFPKGIRATTDYIRSCGLKAGLWIEPEIVGIKCEEMLSYYDDDCFITRFGQKIAAGGRYFLDYRNQKVRDYMTETIRRMVEDYGADYIKFDYNQDLGVGTDKDAITFGEGLEDCAKAYLSWVDSIIKRFDKVVFENCASGGMRLDYEFLSRFSLVSTSDQTNYKRYPYIAGNISCAVLPEQAAVWSYPVETLNNIFCTETPTYEKVNEIISEEQVIFNMVNSFLGRLHLASYINLLNEKKFSLIKEGVKISSMISEFKKNSYPIFPNGLSKYGDEFVVSGLQNGNKIYMAVWNIGKSGDKSFSLDRAIKSVKCIYPLNNEIKVSCSENEVIVGFTKDIQARFLEIIL